MRPEQKDRNSEITPLINDSAKAIGVSPEELQATLNTLHEAISATEVQDPQFPQRKNGALESVFSYTVSIAKQEGLNRLEKMLLAASRSVQKLALGSVASEYIEKSVNGKGKLYFAYALETAVRNVIMDKILKEKFSLELRTRLEKLEKSAETQV